jgi:hypothetical protein
MYVSCKLSLRRLAFLIVFGITNVAAEGSTLDQSRELLAISLRCPIPPSMVQAGNMMLRNSSDFLYLGTNSVFRIRMHQSQHVQVMGYPDHPGNIVEEQNIEVSANYQDLDAARIETNTERYTKQLDGTAIQNFRLGVNCHNGTSCFQWPENASSYHPGMGKYPVGRTPELVLSFCNADSMLDAKAAFEQLIRLNSTQK